MIFIKCRYKYCKNGGIVEKDNAIKEGSAYYCKDCYEEKKIKQEVEEYYVNNFPQTTIQLLRKVINQLLYTNNYSVKYVLFMLKKIKNNNLKLNNPFGLINYCNNTKYFDEWNKQNIYNKYKNINEKIINNSDIKEVNFTYTPNSNNKKWTDLI